MNCANCNTPLRVIHIEGWCPDCVGKLIERETVARAEGWAPRFFEWELYRAGAPGGLVAIADALQDAFQAGWAARGLPDPSRHGMRFAGQDKGGVVFSDSDPSTLPSHDYSGIQAAINDTAKQSDVDSLDTARLRLLRRYENCALRIWKLFPSDPLPEDDHAQFWIDRLESILNCGLLRCNPAGDTDESLRGISDAMRGAGSYQDCGTKGEGIVPSVARGSSQNPTVQATLKVVAGVDSD